MPTCKYTKKKLSHTSSLVYFAFIFSECITITSSEDALKVFDTISFRKYKQKLLLVIYLSSFCSACVVQEPVTDLFNP